MVAKFVRLNVDGIATSGYLIGPQLGRYSGYSQGIRPLGVKHQWWTVTTVHSNVTSVGMPITPDNSKNLPVRLVNSTVTDFNPMQIANITN